MIAVQDSTPPPRPRCARTTWDTGTTPRPSRASTAPSPVQDPSCSAAGSAVSASIRATSGGWQSSRSAMRDGSSPGTRPSAARKAAFSQVMRPVRASAVATRSGVASRMAAPCASRASAALRAVMSKWAP